MKKQSVHKKSIGLTKKLVLYLAVFTCSLLAVLFIVQTVFLDDFYRMMKMSEFDEAEEEIASALGTESLNDKIASLCDGYEMCIQVFDTYYKPVAQSTDHCYSGSSTANCFVHGTPAFAQNTFLTHVKNEYGGVFFDVYDSQRAPSPVGRVHTVEDEKIYLSVNWKETDAGGFYIVISTKITPLRATVRTLRVQLIILTIVFVLLSCVLALILSRRISKPLSGLNDSAAHLAAGDYNAPFCGTGYREVEELSDTLRFAADELSKTEQLRRELIANVSHDLRTPLTMIRGYAEMMRDLPGESTPENMQIIIDESTRLSTLVSDILDLSKLQSGNASLQSQVFCLSDLTAEVGDRIRRMTEYEGITFRVEVEKDLYVSGDPARLEQVLYNLIGNAVNYASGNRYVSLSLRRFGEEAVAEVLDNGPGIPNDAVEKIWQRYYRRADGDVSASGSGLGLAIARDILELHHARYGVTSDQSAERHGSCFWFALPVFSGLDHKDREDPAENA